VPDIYCFKQTSVLTLWYVNYFDFCKNMTVLRWIKPLLANRKCLSFEDVTLNIWHRSAWMPLNYNITPWQFVCQRIAQAGTCPLACMNTSMMTQLYLFHNKIYLINNNPLDGDRIVRWKRDFGCITSMWMFFLRFPNSHNV